MAYAQLLEDPAYELIAGKEIMKVPAGIGHNTVQMNLARPILNFLHGKRCKVFTEAMVRLSDTDHFIPDLMIVCDQSKIKESFIDGAPDFVVEILSPSTKKYDITIKKEAYEKAGVKEYWIIEPKGRSIEVYILRDGKYVLDNVYSVFNEYEYEWLTEEQKGEQKMSIKLSLYDGLEIPLQDIFDF